MFLTSLGRLQTKEKLFSIHFAVRYKKKTLFASLLSDYVYFFGKKSTIIRQGCVKKKIHFVFDGYGFVWVVKLIKNVTKLLKNF